MKHSPRRAQHKFAGEDEGKALVQYLNSDARASDSRIVKRIDQLVRNLNANAENCIKRGVADPKLTKSIDDELARYKLTVKTWQISDEGKYKTFAEPKWIFTWHSTKGSRVAEMIFDIVRLGERGLLARVRSCTRCSRWFFAKFNHQKFCGKKCQLAHYQTSEEWKKRRRERYQNR